MVSTEDSVRVELAELRGSVNARMDCVDKRLDGMHNLLMVLLGIAGGGLITAIVGLILMILQWLRP